MKLSELLSGLFMPSLAEASSGRKEEGGKGVSYKYDRDPLSYDLLSSRRSKRSEETADVPPVPGYRPKGRGTGFRHRDE